MGGWSTRYPLYRRLDGPHGRSGRLRGNITLTGTRSPDRPAKFLYRLRYPVPHVGRVPRNNSIITLKMESECSSGIPMLPFTTSKHRRHMNKSRGSFRYTFFSSYLVIFVCLGSTALELLLSEMLMQRQYNDRVQVGGGGGTGSVVWAGHAQCV